LRARFSAWRHLAIAAVAAALPALIPFGLVNNTSVFESMALQPFAKIVDGRIVAASHATVAAILLSALLAFGYFRAAARPLPSLTVSMTAVALLGMSALELDRQTIPTTRAVLGLPSHNDWVDRAVGGRSAVSLVGGAGVRAIPVDETAFWNSSITRVYHTCG